MAEYNSIHRALTGESGPSNNSQSINPQDSHIQSAIRINGVRISCWINQ